MKKHERNAAHGDLFTSGGEAFQNQEIKDPTEGGKFAKGKVIDLIAPMIVMIFTAIATMIWTGYLTAARTLLRTLPTAPRRSRWSLRVLSRWASCCCSTCRAALLALRTS